MRLNIFLLIALVLSVAANFAIRSDPGTPNQDYLPEMVYSLAYDSYAPNPNFADGKTLQLPVPGTIPRRAVIRNAAATPAASSQAALERGAFVYRTFCQPCHGASGKGDGAVALRGYPPPASLLAEHALGLSDQEMHGIISKGQKNMPSYASQVGEDDRWKVIEYVRSMQRSAKP